MPNYQKIIIEGHIAKDPELLTSKSGKTYTKFPVPWKRKDASGKETGTMWFSVMAFHDDARDVVENFRKGDAVHVEGMLTADAYLDKHGEPRASLTVMAQSIHLAERGQDGNLDDDTGDEDLPF